MSGRHRKPTTSSISMAKIAVTGAVIGGGTIGLAAQAQAATDSEWDVVASCESSGNWSINTGNGYQGGLQFAPSTWLGYGGGQFASAAHLATRDQQIAIAEKVLAGQGRGAWPVCGRGLSGPTLRDAAIHTKTSAAPPAAPVADAPAADAPAEGPAPAAPLDNPLPEVPLVPQDALAPADLPPAPADLTPAPADLPPAPEATAPVDTVPAPAPGEAVPVAPQPQIISISETVITPDADTITIIDAGLIEPAGPSEGVAHLSSQRSGTAPMPWDTGV